MCEWKGGKTFRQRRPCKCSMQTTAAGSNSNNNKSKPPLKVRSALSPSHSHTLALIVFVFLPAVFNCIPFCMLSGVRVSMCACVCVYFRPCSCFVFVFFSLFLQQASNNKNKHGWPNEENTFLLFVFVVPSLTVVVELALSHFACALSRWLACSLTLALNCRAVPVCASSKVNEASTHRRHWRHSVELVLMRAARR